MAFSFSEDIGIKEAVSKLHLEAKTTIMQLKRKIELLESELKQKNETISELESKLTPLYSHKEEIQTLITLLSESLNININHSDSVKKLKQKIQNQQEIISQLKQTKTTQKKEIETSSELFQHPVILQKIKDIHRVISYSQDHIWSIITILLQNKELTIDQITLYTDIARSSTSSIVSKMKSLKLIKKRNEGRKYLYSLNIPYIKTLIKNYNKKQELKQFQKKLRRK